MPHSKGLPPAFINKITRALQEEEIDIYMMMLYCANSEDMNFFSETDREHVRRIFKTLTEDTKHHTELLKMILELGTH